MHFDLDVQYTDEYDARRLAQAAYDCKYPPHPKIKHQSLKHDSHPYRHHKFGYSSFYGFLCVDFLMPSHMSLYSFYS